MRNRTTIIAEVLATIALAFAISYGTSTRTCVTSNGFGGSNKPSNRFDAYRGTPSSTTETCERRFWWDF